MPIEIRELIIKTEISGASGRTPPEIKDKQLEKLRRQILEECKRVIRSTLKHATNQR